MSRGKWGRIKQARFFYVRVYRKLSSWLVYSILLNIVLCFAVIYSQLHKPVRTYYATDGVTAPIMLNAMERPNESSEALLPPDPMTETDTKLIPE
ncbi:type IVB secretion system protein IcmM/DotJ [Legionella sp. CNM-4043-24]|uniref:type IVB secretion system protein IcmM/DotJ n=1 Tax=Legionella sp. CNM-4043-24 TaxID=3421646 RepID=UPI00403B034D